MRRLMLALAAVLALAGCAAERVWAPDEAVARARHVHPGPPELTLLTTINTRSGAGAHTALLINADQRVLFDPAGTWYDPASPERNDLHYGITPAIYGRYLGYHTTGPFRVVMQTVRVSPEVAARAFALAQAAGPVPDAFCTSSTVGILGALPGFESLPRTMFPVALMRAFGDLPGVTTETLESRDPLAAAQEGDQVLVATAD